MKLYRRQLTSFTDATLVSENFISDTSRKFNDTGRNKNEAELFFYSTSAAGADEYRIYDDESGEYLPTERVVYEIESPRLLDLRIIKNRAMMSETVNTLMAAQKAILEKMVADYTHIASTEKKAKDRKRFENFANEANTRLAGISFDSIVNDIRDEAHSLWGQKASDYEAGVSLRADLERMGYDGVIFTEGFSSSVPEVALLKAAKMVARQK